MKLVCAFVFAYANCWFSHAQAHINYGCKKTGQKVNFTGEFYVYKITNLTQLQEGSFHPTLYVLDWNLLPHEPSNQDQHNDEYMYM